MKKFLVLAASVLAFFACSKQDVVDVQKSDSEKAVFHATMEGIVSPGTKIYSDNKLNVLWNADDRITVFNKRTYNDQFKFLGEDGDCGGDFEEIPASGRPHRASSGEPFLRRYHCRSLYHPGCCGKGD